MKSSVNLNGPVVVKGNIFLALGFRPEEATALEIKSEILSAILEHIRAKGYTQAQLARVLDEHQPSVSNLMRGRIGQISIEKLLRYTDRLGLQISVSVTPLIARQKRPKSALTNPQHC